MPNIYSGKASKIEHAATASWPGTDVGGAKSAKINFEPEVFEGLMGDEPVGGYGTAELELTNTTAALRTALEALVNVDTYWRVTSTAGDYYVFHGPVVLQETRDFSDPKNPHIYKITVKRFCNNAGDFCPAPTD